MTAKYNQLRAKANPGKGRIQITMPKSDRRKPAATTRTMLDLIRLGMTANEMTQRAYARAVGVTEGAVSEWLLGNRQPAAKFTEAIARLANVPVADAMRIAGYLSGDGRGMPGVVPTERPPVTRILGALRTLSDDDLRTIEDLAMSLARRRRREGLGEEDSSATA